MTDRLPLLTIVLLAVNIGMFVLCLGGSDGGGFTNRLLYGYGAVTNVTLAQGDYWRLIAAAFLHGNFAHIFSNMLCLLAWAPLVERTLGPARFLGVYLLSAIGGNVTSILMHQDQPYLSVGASGALSGLVGALLALSLTRRIEVSSQFFVSTIALNGVIMSTNPHIDWQDHLGGFVTGLVLTAMLAGMSRTVERE